VGASSQANTMMQVKCVTCSISEGSTMMMLIKRSPRGASFDYVVETKLLNQSNNYINDGI